MKLPPGNVGFAVKTRKDCAKTQTYKISSAAHGQRDHAHGLIFWKIVQHVGSKLGSVLANFTKNSHHAHGLGTPCAWSPPKSKMVQCSRGKLWESVWWILEKSHHAHGLPHHAHGPLKFGLYKQPPPHSKIMPTKPSQNHTQSLKSSLSLSRISQILEKSLQSRRSRVPKQLPTSSRLDLDVPEVFPKSEDPHLA